MFTIQHISSVFKGRTPQPIGRHRYFSVLIPFVEKDGELHLLFEVRAKHMVSQPGEICFPGGHVEPGENPRDAAIRETEEELGIGQQQILQIGQGNILYGYANYTLYTYLGVIPYDVYAKASPARDEVEEIFLMPLQAFSETGPTVYHTEIHADIPSDLPYEQLHIDANYPWRVGRWQIPIYDMGDRIIWGLTAQIVSDLVETLDREIKGQKKQGVDACSCR